MTTDNFVCKTAKFFAVLFLGVLFVTAFTMTNCAWAQTIIGGGQDPINPPGPGTDPPIPGFGGDETGGITFTATIDPIDHDDLYSIGGFGILIADSNTIYKRNEYSPVSLNVVIDSNDQFVNSVVVALTPGNSLTFNRNFTIPDEVEGDWSVEHGILHVAHGSLNIAEGKTITAPVLSFLSECDVYFAGDEFSYIRSISGEFNIDMIEFLDDEDSIMFSANGGNIIFNTKTPANAAINTYAGTISVLSDTKITLKNNLYVAEGFDWNEETQYSDIPSAPGKLTFACEDDATLKVCCEAENSISAESVFISSGRVDIKGVLEATLEVGEGATFSPGNSIETTTVDGNFTLDPGAILLLEIGGENAEDNDQLVLTGENSTATYNEGSTIKVVLDPSSGFEPEYYQEIYVNIPKAEEIDWDKVNFSSDMFYVVRAEDNVLVLSRVVPEPSTWALLILGAAGLMYLRKKNA